jgi:hypothetical protein
MARSFEYDRTQKATRYWAGLLYVLTFIAAGGGAFLAVYYAL